GSPPVRHTTQTTSPPSSAPRSQPTKAETAKDLGPTNHRSTTNPPPSSAARSTASGKPPSAAAHDPAGSAAQSLSAPPTRVSDRPFTNPPPPPSAAKPEIPAAMSRPIAPASPCPVSVVVKRQPKKRHPFHFHILPRWPN